MSTNKIWMVNSFTTTPFTGNPAGVIYPCTNFDEKRMVALAREIGASESAFITHWEPERKAVSLRFFTPTQEVGICTHATVAAFHVLATERGASAGNYTMHCAEGVFEVVLEDTSAHPAITLVQPDRGLQHILDAKERELLAAALGCDYHLILDAVIWRAATPRVLVQLASRKVLNSLKVDTNRLIALGEQLQCPGFYCYTFDGADSSIAAHTRMFSPLTGIEEDPVTGNAAACLALYQHSLGVIDEQERVVYAQGEAMGRPGNVSVSVHQKEAFIVGQAATVWRGLLLL